MINSLNFSLFPNSELLTFTKGALALVAPCKESSPVLTTFFDRVAELQSKFILAFAREVKSPYTQLLAAADQKLDFSFLAFRSYIEAVNYRVTMPDLVDAAAKILDVIRKHGWSANSLGYKAEVAAITNIISELTDKYSGELSMTGAKDWMTEMETALKGFEEMLRQQVTGVPINEPTLGKVRPELVRSLKALFSMISLTHSALPSDQLGNLETALNELIVRSLATVKATETRAGNIKKDEGPNGLPRN